MNFTDTVFNAIISILRASPALSFVISFVLFITTQIDMYLFLMVLIFLGELLNNVLKHGVFKPLMKNNKWPILGYGIRPLNSKNSSQFGDINKPPHKNTYGMPSGHSQTALLFATFLTLMITDYHSSSISKYTQIILISSLVVFTLSILWSRLYLKLSYYTTSYIRFYHRWYYWVLWLLLYNYKGRNTFRKQRK
jgi:membrane-associated phospholipid phosphatase